MKLRFWAYPIIALPLFCVTFLLSPVAVEESEQLNDLLSKTLSFLPFMAFALSVMAIFFIWRWEDSGFVFLKSALISKVLFAPIFAFTFFTGVMGIVGMVAFPFSFVMTIFVIVLDVILFVLPSIYSTIGILKFFKKHGMKHRFLAVLSQWVYVVDVFALLVIYIRAEGRKNRAQSLKHPNDFTKGEAQ